MRGFKQGKPMYLAKRPFVYENRLAKAGEKIQVPEAVAKKMISKGLITPYYKTKENKEAIKVTVTQTSPGWYRVIHGTKEIGKMRKKDAEAYRKKHE